MVDNTSPLLAAAAVSADDVPYVVLNTSVHSEGSEGSASSPDSPRSRTRVPINAGHLDPTTYPRRSIINDTHTIESSIVPFYRHPRFVSFLTGLTLNFLLPFMNGVMLGLGEICANELAFRMGWFGARNIPLHNRAGVPLGLKKQYGKGLFGGGKKKGDDDNDTKKDELLYTDVSPN